MHTPSLPPCRVLIVEDDALGGSLLARLLRHWGCSVDWVRTVEQGAENLAGHTHLILDLDLPDGSGAAILNRIRQQRLSVRVAVCSGTGDLELLSDVAALHPEASFPKPLALAELCGWLRSSAPAR